MVDVLYWLRQVNHEYPLTREAFKQLTGMSDRDIREEIHRLRLEGVRIVEDGAGYWIAETEAEYLKWRKKYMSYPLEMLKVIKAMDGNVPGQIKMAEISAGEQMKTAESIITQVEHYGNKQQAISH